MAGFQRILHPTDFSPAAAAAFEFARPLARDHNATVILLHVAQQLVASVAGMPVVPPPPPQIDRKGLDAQLRAIAAANPHDQEVDRFVTLKHLFGIVPWNVAMIGNATCAAIHGGDGRRQVCRTHYR